MTHDLCAQLMFVLYILLLLGLTALFVVMRHYHRQELRHWEKK